MSFDACASDGGGSFDSGGESGFDSGSASGPFSAPVNSLLSESFDTSLDHLTVERGAGETNRALNAHAHTIGSTISLGDNIREDVGDAFSMEVISHEVAHALAGGGSGDKLLDSGKDDAGESAAHAASSQFRDFVARGGSGPAPRLQPARGGTAMIHRYEAGEHADSVDHAAQTLQRGGQQVDPRVAAQMARQITLSNGVSVTQGQITAMMGDFYGAYTADPHGGRAHFDPAASFAAMDNADPEEMQRILNHVQTEQTGVTRAVRGQGEFTPTAPADLEAATLARHQHTDDHGTTTGYSFLELAQLNTNHFSSESEEGTDNNMGAYGAFHAMSIQAAQRAHDMAPGPERDAAEQRALALEASSQHFMTDRFAAGHQFDKQQLMDANGGGTMANIRASVVHNEMNAGTLAGEGPEGGGVTLHHGADQWQAFGDGQYANPLNVGNRERQARATMSSYGDIDSIMRGDSTAADHADTLATAHQSVPEWDPAVNAAAQRRASDVGALDIIGAESSQIPLAGPYIERGLRNHILHPLEDAATSAWHSVTGAAGRAWDATTDAGGRALDWASGAAHTVEDGASRAWDATTNAVSNGAHAVENGAHRAWDATTNAVSNGAHAVENGASRAWNATTNAVSNGAHAVENGAHRAYDATANAVTNGAHAVSNGAHRAYDATTNALSNGAHAVENGATRAWDATTSAVSNGAQAVQTGASNAWNATTNAVSNGAQAVQTGATNAWNATTNAASTGAHWVGNQASDAWHAFSGMFD